MSIKGVDVSIIQGAIDWGWLKQNDYQFVICRLGVGNDYYDKACAGYLKGAKEAELKTGIYHYVYPLPDAPGKVNRNPRDQAKLHYSWAKQIGAEKELTFIDIEFPEYKDFGKWGCSGSQINQWLIDYLDEYEKLSDQKPVVYTYPGYAGVVKFGPKLSEYKLWLADYRSTPQIPNPWSEYVIWQNSGGKLLQLPTGIAIDTNIAKDLSLWGEAMPAPQPPVVEPIPGLSPEEIAKASEPVTEFHANPNPPITEEPKSNTISQIFGVISKFLGNK